MGSESRTSAETSDRSRRYWWSPAACLAVYIVAVSALEVATAGGRSAIAAIGYAFLSSLLVTGALAVCFADRRPLPKDPIAWTGALCFPLGVMSSLRLITLALPSLDLLTGLLPFEVPLFAWQAIAGAMIVPVLLMGQAVLALPPGPGSFGLPKRLGPASANLTFVVGGLAISLAAYLLLRPRSPLASFGLLGSLIQIVGLVVCVALPEELLFRGLLLRLLGATFRRGVVVLSALLYSVFFLGTRSPLEVLFAFDIGLYFSWWVRRTQSIVPVTIAHGLLLVGWYIVWPAVFSG